MEAKIDGVLSTSLEPVEELLLATGKHRSVNSEAAWRLRQRR